MNMVAMVAVWGVTCLGEGTIVIDGDAAAKQPQVAVDGSGGIHVAYGTPTEVRYATSVDAGKTFTKPVVVARVAKMALGMRRGPRIAATRDAVIIAAVVEADGPGGAAGSKAEPGRVVAWRSTDGGKTWSSGTTLNRVVGSAREGLHALAADERGVVKCVWLDLREGEMTVYGATSEDSGAKWSADERVVRSPAKSICTCCHPSLAIGGDHALVMWRDDIAGARDMYLGAWEGSGGASPGNARKLGKGTWILEQCPMDGGAIAIDEEGRVTTVWTRAERVYACDERNVEALVGPGVQPWAAGGRRGAHVVWLQKRPGKLMYRAAGELESVALASAASDPVIASGPKGRGPVVAAWESVGEARGIAVKVVR